MVGSMRLGERLALAVVTLLLAGCPGPVSETQPGQCSADLSSIQSEIFVPSCGAQGCHGGAQPAASLDLTAADLSAQLVNVPAATCSATRVVPGKPDQSFLYEKITGAPTGCGAPMPLSGSLSAADQECIRQWIAALPAGCDTCGGAGCVDLQTDAQNCGACGNACAAGSSCAGGACTCGGGLTSCGGTCIDTASDPKNCGTCGTACTAAQVCSLGKCSSMCAAGLTKCGSSCVDTTSDAANCGACGASCGTGTCAGSTCSCSGGADPQTDPNNCGKCGNACAPGQTCEAGVCTCGNASVSFASDVQPLFTASCATAGCHAGVKPQGGLILAAGKAYAALVGVAATECNDGRKRVLAGQPSQSYVIDKMMGVDLCSGTKMPKLGSVAAAQIQAVANWICEGAPNN